MNKNANLDRTSAFRTLNSQFSKVVAEASDVHNIDPAIGRIFVTRISGMKELSRSQRWQDACDQWALLILREENHFHWAFVQGMVNFLHKTNGLINDNG